MVIQKKPVGVANIAAHDVQTDAATAERESFFKFDLHGDGSCLYRAVVVVPAKIVDVLFQELSRIQQQKVYAYGFNRGNVPRGYVEQHFKADLLEHIKSFLLKYGVINRLYRAFRDNKIHVAGAMRLHTIELEPGSDARFIFQVTVLDKIELFEWRYLPFKSPKRKKYKDIDRQVETFIEQERLQLENYQDAGLAIGDWVLFGVSPVDEDNKPLLGEHVERFWLRLGDEEIESRLRALFLGKKQGDRFYTINRGLQYYFGDQLDGSYRMCVDIIDMVPSTYFCFDLFKRHFRIKTNKDLCKKLVEVFSYRNDLSQRRTMVEQALQLLLSKHHVVVPRYLVLREQKALLEQVKQNPDYHVYRVQKDFNYRVQQLAEKRAKETVFIDQLAYHENVILTDSDIKSYLNLTQRARTREFIYFEPPASKIDAQEVPIAQHELARTCLREKTINYVIYHLTKK